MTWAYLDHPTPFGIAHRGGDTGGPENTVAAFTSAVEMGYLYLETDVHLSADGVLVAFHDRDLSRLTGDDDAIADLTWDQIRRIELADGQHIPRMEELFDTFPDARFNIDPKSAAAVEPLTDLIEAYDRIDSVCIGSFAEERIAKARHLLGSGLCTSPALPGTVKVIIAAVLWPRWRPPYGCLQIPPRWKMLSLSSPWLIRRIQRLGMQVHFWTINDPAEMDRLLDAGADAIISDNVDELLTVLNRRTATSGR